MQPVLLPAEPVAAADGLGLFFELSLCVIQRPHRHRLVSSLCSSVEL